MPKTGLQVTVLPANHWDGDWRKQDGEGSDFRKVIRVLEERGYCTRLANLNRVPFNPWARRHPLWRAIDPIRALSVLLCQRRTVALCCYESAAIVLLLFRWVLRSPIKVVVFETGTPRSWPTRDRIMRFVVRRADAILQVCSAQIEAVQLWEPRSAPAHFVFDVVDTDYFQPCRDTPDGPVLAVGDDPGRDFETFCSAVAATCVPAIAKTRMITENRVQYPTLCVVQAQMARADYRDLLASASIIIVPLRPVTNASGVTTLLEAMALGKPVIISNSPGMRDYIAHERNCLAVSCGDAEALIASIKRLRNDPELRLRLASAGRAFVVEQCSPCSLANALERVICTLA